MKTRLILLILLCCFLFGCLQPIKTVTIKVDRYSKPAVPFVLPLKNPKILSHFGPRSGWYHTGLDIVGKRGGGDYAYAARQGTVLKAESSSSYGLIVTIQHPDLFISRYAHLRKVLVKAGQVVDAGEPVGIVGATGHASTAHLHFEILSPGGYFMDPEPLLFKKNDNLGPKK